MKISKEVEMLLTKMALLAEKEKHEYVTPEHLLYVLTYNETFAKGFQQCGGNIQRLRENLTLFMEHNFETIDAGEKAVLSVGLNEVLIEAEEKAVSCEKYIIEISHLVSGIMNLPESYAAYYIESQSIQVADLICAMNEIEFNVRKEEEVGAEEEKREEWLQYVTCLNEKESNNPPLVGREKELERTIQILCRQYKNNPLHIGEAGVGKTAITNGLVYLIQKGKVPSCILGSQIYAMDMGTLVAGTQFRGDFEKRFKKVMDGIEKMEKPIVYLDEIHNIVGAGSVNGSSMDVSNLLKPYLTNGKIRFIGATTYEEYKKYFSKSKSLIRRFQNIDIKEPSIEETIEILKGVKKHYEKFHNVRYGKGVLEHAVFLSEQYINERYLPDKAIDLLDEAGAYRAMYPTEKKIQMIDKKLIEEVLSKICNVPKKTIETDEIKKLAVLEKEMKQRVFGQDEATVQLVNAVKFSRAGLNDENKPLSCLLFVGPTGVGKTEMAKSLSELLGVKLIRFDMSEYIEKHAVAKLIGSPAGYVGYEEGGLLTEEIRKNPHSILLLDEIEKAHSDIFNVLLQVMDYATLTDNQGRKADFRNVILIMTSNAGAANVGKRSIGFDNRRITREAIEKEVKKIFQPEFRNRLNRIITFNGIDEKMAEKIVERQIDLLIEKLISKNITLNVTKECKEEIKRRGISEEYGAREIQRVIHSEIKPLLVDQILFGKLKKGGNCKLNYRNELFQLEI